MARALVPILFFLGLVRPAWSADDVPSEARAAWTAMAEVDSLRARFRQVRHTSLLSKPVESTGTLHFRRPDRLAWTVLEPSRSTFVVAGSRVGVSYPDLGVEQVFDVAENAEIARTVQGMTAWLSGDLETIARDYRIAWESTEEGGLAVLTPRSVPLRALVQQMELHVTGSPLRVSRVRIVEPDRDYVTIELFDVDPAATFGGEAFQLPTLPP